MKKLIFILIFFIPSIASAQLQTKDSKWIHVAIASSAITSFGDVYTTAYTLGSNKNVKEANLALAWSINSPINLGLVKGSIAAGQVEALIYIHKTHPKLSFVLAGVSTSLNTWAMIHNAHNVGRRK